jgi:hypothetical protein
MGFAKLDIWIRDAKCCSVIDKPGHLHVYNCCGQPVLAPGWVINHGHAEVQIPPGTYIVVAGVLGGNLYTERAMVIVRCGEEACVNLILPHFASTKNPELIDIPIAIGGCPERLIPALVMNAMKKNIDPKPALDIIIKTAEIDKKQFIASIEYEIKQTAEIARKDEEAKKYVESLQKIKAMIEKGGVLQ